jgi:hypothetical protein
LKDPVSWVAEELRGVTLIERIPWGGFQTVW